jgi:hypothetical protein
MKALLTTGALVIGCLLINDSPALSQNQWHPLSHAQRQAYYACLTSAWVADFCRSHSWGIYASYDLTYAACVAADAPRRTVTANPYFTPEEYCWRRTRGLLR